MNTKLFFLAILFPFSTLASDPELILPKTKVIHPLTWYEEQASLWKEKTFRDKKQATSWLNYYIASRYARASEAELAALVSDAELSVPNTYESLIMKGFQAGYSPQAVEFFRSAFTMNPNLSATYAPLVLGAELLGDLQTRKTFSERLLQSDLLSSSLLNYSYNVLMSLESNAILVTEGENTTLPLMVLQDVMNIREDVVILSIDLMSNEAYRSQKLAAHNLSASSSESLENTIALLPLKNPALKFYYSLTLPGEEIGSIKDQLYVVGLASQFSDKRIDNLSSIRENLEKKFLLDYLTVDFNGESEFAAGKVLSANYLVPMLMLYEHYLQTNQPAKAAELEILIKKIAAESGKELLVRNYLSRKNDDVIPFIRLSLNGKALENAMRKISPTLYGAFHEVTNADYNAFLKYLVDNNLNDQYEKFKFDLSQYEEPAISFMKGYSAAWVPTKKNKYFTNHPAVNMSYEGALAYCEWLTDQYNQVADRKYKKVKFRLPTLKEWQIAALGYKKFKSWDLEENMVEVGVPKNTTDELAKETRVIPFKGAEILYPWFGSYNYRNKALNRHGCALGNFKFPEDTKPCPSGAPFTDGFSMMSPVASYFPNGMGLFDVVGNVAEMIDEKGKACGGSWNQSPEESTIQSVSTYDKPDASVGFRVFMEVIEP